MVLVLYTFIYLSNCVKLVGLKYETMGLFASRTRFNKSIGLRVRVLLS
jgi:hypothetical protein